MLENKDLKIGQKVQCIGNLYKSIKNEIYDVLEFSRTTELNPKDFDKECDMIYTRDGYLKTSDFKLLTITYFVSFAYTSGFSDPFKATQCFGNGCVDVEEPIHLAIETVQKIIADKITAEFKLQHVNVVIISYQKI